MDRIVEFDIEKVKRTTMYVQIPEEMTLADARRIVEGKIDSGEWSSQSDYRWSESDYTVTAMGESSEDDDGIEWDLRQPDHDPLPPTVPEPEEKHWFKWCEHRWVTDGRALIREGEPTHAGRPQTLWNYWRDNIGPASADAIIAHSTKNPARQLTMVGSAGETERSGEPINVYVRDDGSHVHAESALMLGTDDCILTQCGSPTEPILCHRDGELVRVAMPRRID